MPTNVVIDSGGEWLIGVARNLLARLKLHRAATGAPMAQTVLTVPSGETILVRSIDVFDLIRITAGRTPWYFYTFTQGTLADGVRPITLRTWKLLAVPEATLSIGSFRDGSYVAASGRAVGRAAAFFWNPNGGGGVFAYSTGLAAAPADPLSVLGSVVDIQLAELQIGRARTGVIFYDKATGSNPVPKIVYFTDGSVTQKISAAAVGTVSSLYITGDLGEEDAYVMRTDSSSPPYDCVLFRMARSQPVDGSGNPTAIPDDVVLSSSVDVDALNRDPIVAVNDYDVLTAICTGGYNDGAGATKIYIGGSLAWSSPGTSVGASFSSATNYDDCYIIGAWGYADKFSVLLANYRAYVAIVEPSLTTVGGDARIREIVFSRSGSSYTSVENVYSFSNAYEIDTQSGFCSFGFRTAIVLQKRTAAPSVTVEVGVMKEGAYTLSIDYGEMTDGASTYVRAVVVSGMAALLGMSSIKFALDVMSATRTGSTPSSTKYAVFIDSESAAAYEYDIHTIASHTSSLPFATKPTYFIGVGGETAWATFYNLSGNLVLVSEDGDIWTVEVNGARFDNTTQKQIVLDETARTAHLLLADIRVGDTVNYGTVQQSATNTRVFEITNSGADPIAVSSPTVPSGFTLTVAPPAVIASGASGSFTVAVNSATTGFKIGTLSVAYGALSASYTLSALVTASAATTIGDGTVIPVRDEHSNIARLDLATQTVTEYGGANGLFPTFPAESPLYRGRLVRQWLAEDA